MFFPTQLHTMAYAIYANNFTGYCFRFSHYYRISLPVFYNTCPISGKHMNLKEAYRQKCYAIYNKKPDINRQQNLINLFRNYFIRRKHHVIGCSCSGNYFC